ncbi:MAG: DUF362 domain-containing protein [Bacteroidota bacterium]
MKRKICKTEDSKLKKFLLKNAFPLFGLGALIWFLIRVVPKPSRAAYPCMRVAAPMASSFVLWILGLSATIFSFKKMKTAYLNSSYGYVALFMVITVGAFIFTLNQGSVDSKARNSSNFEETVTPNNPIGEAKGINPGAVVWVWNPDATNENCKNKYYGSSGAPADTTDDGWFLSKNNNQIVIDSMLSDGLKKLTGKSSNYNAWDTLFTFFNQKKHGRNEGYKDGEQIFIKINATSTWGKGQSWGNISANNEHMRNDFYGIAETSPHLILSLLRQLINVCGVPQENIFVGDPMKHIYNNSFDLWNNEFPDVHYMAIEGDEGREQVVPTGNEIIYYSDKGNEMSGAVSDKIYTVMNEADYLINVPTMKAHGLAGITLFAKNHFGSHTRGSAEHLHPGLIATEENANPIRTDSSMYRVQVDLMGHERLGGNQVLFLLDALWSGSEAIDPPTKWDMEPFNGDWTSSIFLSQDMVAIESVAFDFLYTEYDGSYNIYYQQKVNYPHMKGTSDYLRQAASSDFWPDGIIYDPENDGTPISSLGVNEHWNNPIDKQYTRNLETGNGINLIFIDQTITDVQKTTNHLQPKKYTLYQNYPNPFNPSTKIKYSLSEASKVELVVYDGLGQEIQTVVNTTQNAGTYEITFNATNFTSGIYFYRLKTDYFIEVKKMILLK